MVCNILVTRPKAQAESLCQLLEQQGCRAIRLPTLEIMAVDSMAIKQQIAGLNQYHWLIFISANAVHFALAANNGKIDAFQHSAIAAVGRTTEQALKTAGLVVNLVPTTQFNTEGLLDTPQMRHIAAKSCLIIRGTGGREMLMNSLRMRGAKVDYMEVYSRQCPVYFDERVIPLLQNQQITAMTITCDSALTNLLAMIDISLHDKIYLIPIIVISCRLKEIAKKMGFIHIMVAKSPEDSAIVEAVLLSINTKTHDPSTH